MQILCELDDATPDVPDGTVERSKVLLEAQSECEASEQRVKLPCTLRQWRTWAHGEYVQHIQDLDHVLAVLKVRVDGLCCALACTLVLRQCSRPAEPQDAAHAIAVP